MKPIVPISKFKEGETVQGFYLCVEKHLRHTRAGDLFIDLVLRDRTGKIHAKIWNKIEDFDKKFSKGDAVAAKGEVEYFLDRPQLTIKRINKATVQNYARYGFDPALIVPIAAVDPKVMWKEVLKIIKSIKNPFLKKLSYNIYDSHKEKLLTHPASVSVHHNYRSGFLEHVLNMLKSAKHLAPQYNLDIDLVIAGILLHDIGKLFSIKSEYQASYTDEGNLLGHIVIGRDMVRNEAKSIKKFPQNLLLNIEHIILSHQGKYEWHSPKKPAFSEALFVHLIDLLDSQMNIMDQAISNDQDLEDFTSKYNYYKIPLLKRTNAAK